MKTNGTVLSDRPPSHPFHADNLDKLVQSSLNKFPSAKSSSVRPSSESMTKNTATNNFMDRPQQQRDATFCYGKVQDLESMVPPQWWKTVFADAMYLKTDGDVVEDPEITKEEVSMMEMDEDIKRVFLKGSGISNNGDKTDDPPGPPAKILDLCCGQGRHSLHLAKEYPHLLLHGHDQSSYLISLAQERASFQNLTSNTFFTVGDCRQIPYPDDTFDLVMVMGNSFGYFSDEDSDRIVLSEIYRVLAPGGRLVLDLTDGGYMRNNFAERSWEWVDDTCFVCRERQLNKDGTRLSSREVVTITNKGVVRDQFYQERLYSRQDIDSLVEDSGLMVVKESDLGVGSETLITITKELSKRNEDLGMMEQRMLVKGVKSLDAKPSSSTTSNNSAVGPTVARSLSAPPHIHSSSLLYKDQLRPISTAAESSSSSYNAINSNNSSPFPSPSTLVSPSSALPPMQSSATGLKAVTEIREPPPPFSSFAVILGDPTKPCFGKRNNTWNPEDFETRHRLMTALFELGYPATAITFLDGHGNLHHTLGANPPPFVFNLCDEGFDNDALKELHVPALLDMLNIPYSGAGPNCLAYCYDKGLVNQTAVAIGVPVPRETYFLPDNKGSSTSDLEHLHRAIEEDIKYPAFIKPLKGDNSLGITGRSVVRSRHDLDSYVRELHSQGIRDVIVQEYLQGTEYGIGMVGNTESGFHFFPILEVDYSKIVERKLPPILGYESKWDPTSPYWSEISYKRATLSREAEENLQRHCIALWERFGCRDYARFDFRCDRGTGDNSGGGGGGGSGGAPSPSGDDVSSSNGDDQTAVDGSGSGGSNSSGGTIKLLEVNPNPGWCWDGKLAYMGKLEGKEYRDIVRMILQAAWDRLYGKANTSNGHSSAMLPLFKARGSKEERQAAERNGSGSTGGDGSSVEEGGSGSVLSSSESTA